MADLLIEKPELISDNSLKLFSHILNAHQIWNTRIDPRDIPFGVWDIHSIQNFKSINQANFENSISIIDNFDFERIINYTNSQGQNYDSSVRDILFHVVNHSTYHRAQLVTEFKENGLESFVSDYIFYRR
ncbi:DinB family protein [Algoriphagus marinus]|uniref:DinB family protein n=1 Tax=Algoriphagus marinus TaxID=1925762 RepID=UPI001FEC0EB5|nr:DinB family protein [Algoriphagus marinus]